MSAPNAAVANGWRWRDREWSWFAASLALASVATALLPELDLWISALFFDAREGFAANQQLLVRLLYAAVPRLGWGLALAALAAVLLHASGSAWPGPRWRRRLLLLGLAQLLGVGLVANAVLKESWGRARPVAVQAFGGEASFAPALRPARQCRSNCAFVSGHAATGFALGAMGLLGAPALRRRWLLVGMAAGLVIGLGRIAQGAHFASDVLFSALVAWGCNLALRALWLRWVARRRRRRAAGPSPAAGIASP